MTLDTCLARGRPEALILTAVSVAALLIWVARYGLA
jgi:lambda repressor-like predicted transcriptional regulator